MSVNVGVMIWERVGPEDDKKVRVLAKRAFAVEEIDLHELPFMGFELGREILTEMTLEVIGRRRSESVNDV